MNQVPRKLYTYQFITTINIMIVIYIILTLIATGWIVLLFSKLPFLNIITDVLFIHVPEIENVL
jgi:hypothetical protein